METQLQYIPFSIGNTEFTLLLQGSVLGEGDRYYSEVHFHGFHELHLLFDGKLYVDTDASIGAVMTGSTGCVFPPRIYHRVYLAEKETYKHITLKFFFRKRPESTDAFDSYSLFRQLFSYSEPLFFAAQESLLPDLWDALQALTERGEGNGGSFLSARIANIVSLLFITIAAKSPPRSEETAVQTCREYDKSLDYYLRFARIEAVLQSYILTGRSEDNIEDVLFLSTKQIYRIVEQEYGDNYRHFVRNCRMKRAEFLLKHNEYSIEQISEIVGYNSVSAFSAMFKKVCRVTPLEYRKRFAHKG